MRYDSIRHHRHSLRMRGYDYAWEGTYFVTICTQNRQCLLGKVLQGEMIPDPLGQMVINCWQTLPTHFDTVSLDAFVVMPNHIHGIIGIVGAGSPRPARQRSCSPQRHAGDWGAVTAPLQRPSLGQIVASFKYRSTKKINDLQKTTGQRFWQRNYYERIIRNDEELNRIRQYIHDNPHNWENDPENKEIRPGGSGTKPGRRPG